MLGNVTFALEFLETCVETLTRLPPAMATGRAALLLFICVISFTLADEREADLLVSAANASSPIFIFHYFK
jgi:hypothetical protein